jgi:uncharacterized membrane protein YfcA
MAIFYETFLPVGVGPTDMVLIAGVFLIAGVIKGFLGIGLPAAAMAFLTLIMEPTSAISLMILPIVFTNFVQFTRSENRLQIAMKYKWFAVAIMFSIFLTSLFITSFPTAMLTVAIGCAMVAFSINLLFRIPLPISDALGWQVGVGLFSGVLGGLSSIWSPPVAMYLLARNTPKEEFIGATGFLFLAGCIPLAIGLIISGVVTSETLLQSLIGLVVVMCGFRVGEILRRYVSHDLFRTFVLTAFLLMGARLIATGLL